MTSRRHIFVVVTTQVACAPLKEYSMRLTHNRDLVRSIYSVARRPIQYMIQKVRRGLMNRSNLEQLLYPP